MKRWICMEGHEFDSPPENMRCPYDGTLVKELREERVIEIEEIKEEDEEKLAEIETHGDHGLGILIFDMSPSMEEPFRGEKFTKLEVVANAFATTIASLLSGDSPISKPNNYFISIIGFSGNIEYLGTFRLSDMNRGTYEDTVKYWEDFIIKYPKGKLGQGTNITKALEMAHEIYTGALNREESVLKKYNFPDDFELGVQTVYSLTGEVNTTVPNVRVFVYSDGVHNVGPFRNPFVDETLWPGLRSEETKTPVNGVLSIFICSENEGENKVGTETMRKIAGFCPQHGTIGFVSIDNIEDYKILRGFIHMTSRVSGFCLKCLNLG